MDVALQRLAQKLNEFDEASLMNLWEKYAEQVHSFEPTKRWEEAALVLCLIQAMQWKNRLFNYHVLQQHEGRAFSGMVPSPVVPAEKNDEKEPAQPLAKKTATILEFPQKKE